MSMGQRPAKQSLTKYTDVLLFGKFKGHTVEYILKREPSYLMWLDDEKVCEVDFEILNDALDRDYEESESYGFMDDEPF